MLAVRSRELVGRQPGEAPEDVLLCQPLAFPQFLKDVVRADDAVLEVRPGLPLEAQRLFHVENNQLAPRVLQHEVPDGGDGDLRADPALLVFRQLRIPLGDLRRGLGLE